MNDLMIDNVRVYGLEESIYASGYPMMTKMGNFDEEVSAIRRVVNGISDFKRGLLNHDPREDEYNAKATAHIERMMRLGSVPKGTGHDQALTGIIVQFDLTFTKQAWCEAERYSWLDFVSSCSTMHRLKDMDINDACIEYVDPIIKARIDQLQMRYAEDPSRINYLNMIYSCPVGLELTARMTTNYRQLKTIWSQRRTHRLPEWRQFCDWIVDLPMFMELCVKEEAA